MGSKNWTPASRRYQYRVIGASLLYAAALLLAIWLFKHHPPGGLLRYAVAMAPALPLLGIFASLGLFLKEEGDEFQRALMVEQVLWAMGGTLSLATIWGFMESFDVVPHIASYYIAVTWFAMFGAARCLVWWRYR